MLVSPPSPPSSVPSPSPAPPPPPLIEEEQTFAGAVGATSFLNLSAIFTPSQEPFSSLPRLESQLGNPWVHLSQTNGVDWTERMEEVEEEMANSRKQQHKSMPQ